MKRKLLYFFLPLMAVWSLLGACVDVEQYDNNPRGNFEALWRIIDEHYCFFDYKQQEYGLDWHAVYNKYAPQFDDQMTEEQTFEVLTNMLGELKDGHVNLYAPFDVGRDWSWKEDYPTHFSENVLKLYLGKDYKIAAGMKYRILNDNVAYLRCATFVNDFGAGNLDRILLYFAPCNGLIIDLRENGAAFGGINAAVCRGGGNHRLDGQLARLCGLRLRAFFCRDELPLCGAGRRGLPALIILPGVIGERAEGCHGAQLQRVAAKAFFAHQQRQQPGRGNAAAKAFQRVVIDVAENIAECAAAFALLRDLLTAVEYLV